MTYTPTWTNANTSGRLAPAEHYVRLPDAQELADAINRRRLLTYQGGQDFSSDISALADVRTDTISSADAPPFDSFRNNFIDNILSAPVGTLGGSPPTPTAMNWLWPVAGTDENKRIVSGVGGVNAGEIGLFQQLNGTTGWTDPSLIAGTATVRAVHFNELRQSVEWLSRGRWELPIYFSAGLFSPLPYTPWAGQFIANNGSQELRSIGFSVLHDASTPTRGLQNVTVRTSSVLEITTDTSCTVELRRVLRPLDFVSDPPTWMEHDPGAMAAWSSAGATGVGDSIAIGSLTLAANTPAQLTGSALAAALQAVIDGAEQNLLIRRTDTGTSTIAVTGRLIVEFDLDNPPN